MTEPCDRLQRHAHADVATCRIAYDFDGSAQFEAFNEFVAQRLIPVQMSTDDVSSFRARAHSANLGVVQLSDLWARNPFVARRTRKHIAGGIPEYLKVGVQLRGVSVVSQGGQQATLMPGDFVLYDTARPYQLSAGASFHMQVVMFPRNALRLSPSQLERLSARPINGREGLGSLVSEYLAALARQLAAGTCSGSCHLADATLDLLAASFADQLGCTGKTDMDCGKAGLLLRVRTHIEQRLGDRDLDVPSIAAAHHVSVRTLQKLFESQEQTVTGWIRGRRIEHCRRDLANVALAHQSVGSIAANWGFIDQAHFSRLFKSTYGLSPREYRIQALR